ncbi:MAG: DUF2914 domain-containing protein [Polyangiaceae bacterium]|nr:DUF2914 domain-containing protein [Polyangiaceae bacterium]
MGARRTTYAAALAALTMAISLVGCDDRKQQETAKPAPDVLAAPPELMKPAGNDSPGVKGEAPKPVSDAEPSEEGAAEDIYEDSPANTKPKRASAKHDKGRKRASTASKGDDAPSTDGAGDGTPEATAPVPLRVKRIQFSESIASREPVDPEETFVAGDTDKLYAFIELSNETKKKSKIVVRFIPPGGSSSKVTLDVGDKSRWRTWALRRGVKTTGTWTVTVSDAEGHEIGRRSFEVTGQP